MSKSIGWLAVAAAFAAMVPMPPHAVGVTRRGKRGRGGGSDYTPGTPLRDEGGYVWVGGTRIRTEKARKLGYPIAAPEENPTP